MRLVEILWEKFCSSLSVRLIRAIRID